MTLRYTKADRLLSRRDFLQFSRCSSRYASKFFIIEYCLKKNDRLGITATTHFGNAILRNKYKRWIREIFRLNRPFGDIDIHVILRAAAKKATFNDLKEEFLKFKQAIALLCCQQL